MPGSGQAIAGQLLEGTAVRLSPTAAAGTTVPGAGELARVIEDVRAEQPPYAVGRERVRTRIARRLQEQAERRSGPRPNTWTRRIERARALTDRLDTVWPTARPEEVLIVHRGAMDAVLPTAQALARWIDGNGYRSAGYPREINLECPDDRDEWVTELQAPVAKP